jgi:hypothetical protein
VYQLSARGALAALRALLQPRRLCRGYAVLCRASGRIQRIGRDMKSKTLRKLIISQLIIVILLLFLTIGNEILDLPHLIFGDQPTSFGQRTGEIIIEVLIFATVLIIEGLLFKNLYRRIRILEGLLPICANCKKVRHEEQWEQVEQYIAEHSLAKFSHSLCPDCARKLYPEIFPDKDYASH